MPLLSPINSNQLQHLIYFLFKIGFSSRTEQNKNNNIDSDFIRGTEYPKI